MRITGGSARGCRLSGPDRKDPIRPTSDRVREALFNILGHNLTGMAVLDLFCGMGGLGLEALSRGASPVFFVDRSNRALTLAGRNLRHCFHNPSCRLIRMDLGRNSSWTRLADRIGDRQRFDLVFLDPPYEKKLAQQTLKMVEVSGLLAPGARVVAEERANQDLPQILGMLSLEDRRIYGGTGLWLYRYEPLPHSS